MMAVDWDAIRHLSGSQSAGFEELCAQLARSESPSPDGFVRKGSPDAGVECFCALPDGNEWGWQAKYFLTLNSSRWSQIDESVRNALDKHPKLARYYICVPMNRADARLEGQTSALERWDQHVEKWKGWSHDRGMSVEFVWWGSSELVDRLSKPEHIGRLYYWFGKNGFDRSWFQSRFDEARRTAGPRYTPELHIELDIAQQLEIFGRTGYSINRLKSMAVGIRKSLQRLRRPNIQEGELLAGFDLERVVEATDATLSMFADLEAVPVGELPLCAIANQAAEAESAVSEIVSGLHRMGRDYDERRRRDGWDTRFGESPPGQLAGTFSRLRRELDASCTSLIEASEFANSRLMIIHGAAGTGKTHLLCDFARSRVEAGAPCVLLMGQRFTESADPWGQVLEHVGMHGDRVEHFVGALEATAQVANSRALVMIDAVNEGRGREIWPSHLPTFLARLEKSPWIAVVLSVRTAYEEVVIPGDVRERATSVTHHGFEGYEYDAAQSFFAHYDLEFPSSPVLHPEYGNPLYLKTICEGLSRAGETRLPRGFHGITSAFNLYLDAVNKQLADTLDYNPQNNLVRKALSGVARQFLETRQRWLPREQVETLVDDLLPGRGFSRSLYFGLVSAGALVEDLACGSGNLDEEVVFIGYERFADHIVADFLLEDFPDGQGIEEMFAEGGRLSFLKAGSWDSSRGLIAALCIQMPERFGRELPRVAPQLVDHIDIGELFLESLVWRRLDAFSDDTKDVLNQLVGCGAICEEPVDTWLTVSTITGHPFNAEFLDRRLREDVMADRDAWWSRYLHYAWKDNGPVDRLVDWASSISPEASLETEAIDLSATSLAWMLTTSNRFLRDGATKAMVSLLTGRIASVESLVKRFADVDDPYVVERVYAVAYGAAMRSHDPGEVGKLATLVYEKVFASGFPPAHDLLRDHARGVVERALHLGADIPVDQRLIWPPYQSEWPFIPDEETLDALVAQRDQPVRVGMGLARPCGWLQRSVMEGDFAIYVIGIQGHARWLSVPLSQERWQSPEERLQSLLLRLSDSERAAWEEYEDAYTSLPYAFTPPVSDAWGGDISQEVDREGDGPTSDDVEATWHTPEAQTVETLWDRLAAAVKPEHRVELKAIYRDIGSDVSRPSFDLRLVQRYILWRVFDLGWTAKRFGQFDGLINRDDDRQAGKAERIGKKYQWIAYHEILAHISDHYQYWSPYFLSDADGDREYEGPWQDFTRDIDPSWTRPFSADAATDNAKDLSWWRKPSYPTWGDSLSDSEWLDLTDDVPSISELLRPVCPDDQGRWLNVDSFLLWKQPHPADVAPFDVERREIWLRCAGFFVRAENVDEFMVWARRADAATLNRYQVPELSRIYIGEHGWAPAFKCIEDELDAEGEPFEHSEWWGFMRPASVRYSSKPSDFDCSSDVDTFVHLPHHDFIGRVGLKWCGMGAEFLDPSGKLATFEPREQDHDCHVFLIREDFLNRYLSENNLALCWVVQGEKSIIGGGTERVYEGRNTVTAVYRHTGSVLEGNTVFERVLPAEVRGDVS